MQQLFFETLWCYWWIVISNDTHITSEYHWIPSGNIQFVDDIAITITGITDLIVLVLNKVPGLIYRPIPIEQKGATGPA
jgi:hypothetical protein